MARRWTPEEESAYREELHTLYVVENKSIREIAEKICISEKTVYDRLIRLGIPVMPERKKKYCNKRAAVHIPERSERLAEFFGIMLGDGHVSRYQVMVTLGTKELEYVDYVRDLMSSLFQIPATIGTQEHGKYRIVYIGSRQLTQWLYDEGLVPNKVEAQVAAPTWVFETNVYMRAFLRGFFDTDGSIYRLRHGRQISFTNVSLPLLYSLQNMLIKLGYKPSAVSSYRVYLTRRDDIDRFFSEVQPANQKHLRRYLHISQTQCVGTQAVNGDGL